MRDAPNTRWQRHAPFCSCTLILAHVCSFATAAAAGLLSAFLYTVFFQVAALSLQSLAWPLHWKCFQILQAHSSFICRSCVLLLLLHGRK